MENNPPPYPISTEVAPLRHTPEMVHFVQRVFTDFQYAQVEKRRSWRELNNKTLEQFWRQSRDDYNVLIPAKKSWHKRARRAVTRDKVNAFLANICSNVIKGEILAINPDLDFDRIAARVLRGGVDDIETKMKWQRKFIPAAKTVLTDGTVHIREDLIHGQIIRREIPNEAIYIKNAMMPDLQEQEVIFEADETSYHEAKMEFGHLENFAMVNPGSVNGWLLSPLIQEIWSGALTHDKVLILRVSYHQGYNDDGTPKRKLTNVLVNDVPMFPVDNLSPFKHGLHNYTKGIFEHFANSKFYWGNSLPNKLKPDANLADAFYSMILNKQYLSIFPTLVSRLNQRFDEDDVRPGGVLQTTEDVRSAVTKIPGIGEPLNTADFETLKLIDQKMDDSATAQSNAGMGSSSRQTAREVLIKQENIKMIMGLFGRMIAFLVEDLTEQTMSNFLQFYTRQNFEEVAGGKADAFKGQATFSKQTLNDGKQGDLKVTFTDDIPDDGEERLKLSRALYRHERKQENPVNHVIVSPSYLDTLKLHVVIVANPVEELSKVQREALAIERYKNLYFNNPNVDQQAATRRVIRAVGDPEDELLQTAQQPMPAQKNGMRPGVGRMTSALTGPLNNFGLGPEEQMQEAGLPAMGQA